METGLEFFNESSPDANVTKTDRDMFMKLASEIVMHKIGSALGEYYLPIMAPPGVVGNILSFLIMMRKHNRQMSFSVFVSALAVTDTLTLLISCRYFLVYDHMKEKPSEFWYCSMWNIVPSQLCSTLFILSMTFERFYSIVQPHRAASFNTVKRAKIIITFVVLFSFGFNFPHLFITLKVEDRCIPFGKAMSYTFGQFYYWLSLVVNFFLPFVLLLIMNSFIIHILRRRSRLMLTEPQGQGQSQGQGQGQGSRVKSSEKQIYITLLLVTFSFLVLTTPGYIFFFYAMYYNYQSSPESFAEYHLFANVSRQAFFTNYGINFYLYVLSGKKFRTDLINLFKCCPKFSSENMSNLNSSQTATKISSVSGLDEKTN